MHDNIDVFEISVDGDPIDVEPPAPLARSPKRAGALRRADCLIAGGFAVAALLAGFAAWSNLAVLTYYPNAYMGLEEPDTSPILGPYLQIRFDAWGNYRQHTYVGGDADYLGSSSQFAILLIIAAVTALLAASLVTFSRLLCPRSLRAQMWSAATAVLAVSLLAGAVLALVLDVLAKARPQALHYPYPRVSFGPCLWFGGPAVVIAVAACVAPVRSALRGTAAVTAEPDAQEAAPTLDSAVSKDDAEGDSE